MCVFSYCDCIVFESCIILCWCLMELVFTSWSSLMYSLHVNESNEHCKPFVSGVGPLWIFGGMRPKDPRWWKWNEQWSKMLGAQPPQPKWLPGPWAGAARGTKPLTDNCWLEMILHWFTAVWMIDSTVNCYDEYVLSCVCLCVCVAGHVASQWCLGHNCIQAGRPSLLFWGPVPPSLTSFSFPLLPSLILPFPSPSNVNSLDLAIFLYVFLCCNNTALIGFHNPMNYRQSNQQLADRSS